MSTVIIDYGSGNLHSAQKAFERVVRERSLSQSIEVSADPDRVRAASRVVLPGVGAFADCRRGLFAVPGMVEALVEQVRVGGKPFLGICVGMQLLATRGLEHEVSFGLDWIKGDVRRIEPSDPTCKIPHMGWNQLEAVRPHPLLAGISLGAAGLHAYFVHSYQFAAADSVDIISRTDHGGNVTAMVARGNIAGVQFHPEKSQALGLALIGNFLAWRP